MKEGVSRIDARLPLTMRIRPSPSEDDEEQTGNAVDVIFDCTKVVSANLNEFF